MSAVQLPQPVTAIELKAMKIIYDKNICVRCLACVTESEFGGVTYERGRIFFDVTKPEDWENIFSTCPVAAIKKAGSETSHFPLTTDH